MADFSGTVRFICDTKDRALVNQTPNGATSPDGYRFVKSADFSTEAVGNSINYNYETGFASDGHGITII